MEGLMELCRVFVLFGILVPISFGFGPIGRDIDPGIATRRRFCTTQTRRSPEILDIFQGNERHGLRVVRTHLGRLPVILYSFPACPGQPVSTREGNERPFLCTRGGLRGESERRTK